MCKIKLKQKKKNLQKLSEAAQSLPNDSSLWMQLGHLKKKSLDLIFSHTTALSRLHRAAREDIQSFR